MKRSHSKFKILLFLLCGVVFLTLVFNIILARERNKIIGYLQKRFSLKVSIGQAIYLPPNFIIIQNVGLQQPEQLVHNPAIFIPMIAAKFSLSEIFTKKQLFFSDLTFYKPNLNYSDLRYFKENYLKQVIVLLRSLPKQDINLFIKGMRVGLVKENPSSGYITIDSTLKMKGNLISGSGSINKHIVDPLSEENPLKYNFKVLFSDEEVLIENFELKSNNYYTQLNAKYDRGAFKLNGYAFMNRRAFSWLPEAKLYLLDIDCHGNFNFPKLQIKQLNFSLNNNPVTLKGEVLFSDPVLLDLNVTSLLKNLGSQTPKDVKRAELKVKGSVNKDSFKTSGELDIESLKRKNDGSILEKFNFVFSNLSLKFSGFPNLKAYLANGKFDYLAQGNQYALTLIDLNAAIYLKNKKMKFIKFSTPFYEGSLNGLGWIDTASRPLKFSTVFRLRNVNANKLSSLLSNFSNIFGNLDSQIYFSNLPRPYLKGDIIIHNGYLDDLDFFSFNRTTIGNVLF